MEERHGFLAFNDIQSDYYQIPSEDKEKLREAEEKIREQLKNKNDGDTQENNQLETNNTQTENNKLENENILKSDDSEKKHYRDEIKSSFGIRRYKIQEVIKPGQVVLIQVIKKKEVKKEPPHHFYFISWEIYRSYAKYKGGGISRKIFSSSDRQKIRNILNEISIPVAWVHCKNSWIK